MYSHSRRVYLRMQKTF